MSELVKVDTDGKITARELYDFLRMDASNFSRWVKSNITNNPFAVENDDWLRFVIYDETPTGGKIQRDDYKLSLDFAKKLCMTSKTERGEQARNYFIEIEKRFKAGILPDFSNPAVAARAWADEYEAKLLAQAEVKVLQPKARYYDLILNNKEVLPITVIAKDYGMTAQQLNTKLAELGIQYKRGEIWYLYDQFAGEGYTQARTYQNDEMDISATRTYWTQKGRRFIYDTLKEEGILPLIEAA